MVDRVAGSPVEEYGHRLAGLIMMARRGHPGTRLCLAPSPEGHPLATVTFDHVSKRFSGDVVAVIDPQSESAPVGGA